MAGTAPRSAFVVIVSGSATVGAAAGLAFLAFFWRTGGLAFGCSAGFSTAGLYSRFSRVLTPVLISQYLWNSHN
jgi:hypothetical protein